MKKIIKENWFKIIITLLVIIVFCIYYFGYFLPEKRQTALLNLQEKCSLQAKSSFTNSGLKDVSVYTNHFNQKLNECFILISKITPTDHGGIATYEVLSNVLENKTYGEYGDSDYGADPYTCNILGKNCSSRAVFDSFVNSYMNN